MSEWKIIWINPVSSSLIHRYSRSRQAIAGLVSLWPLTFKFLPMILCRHSCSLCVTWFDLSGKHFFSVTVWFSRFSSWLKFHGLWLKSVNMKWCFYLWKDQTYERARLKHLWMRHVDCLHLLNPTWSSAGMFSGFRTLSQRGVCSIFSPSCADSSPPSCFHWRL